MLRKKFFLIAFAAATFAACSESDEFANNITGVEDNTPVEVKLRVGGLLKAITKAAINTNTDGTFEDITVGVYGLARAKQGINQEAADINWFAYDGTESTEQYKTCCIVKNQKSEVDGTTGEITFVNGPFFYPITQFYRYDFYAYYPCAETTGTPTLGHPTVLEESSSISSKATAQYVIDGTQDLIWGFDHKDQYAGPAYSNQIREWVNLYSYSARWFRQVERRADCYPNIKMQHLLTRLTFFVEPGANTEGGSDYSDAEQMQLDELYVKGVYSNINVVVANQTNMENPTVDDTERISPRNYNTANFYLYDAPDADGIQHEASSIPVPSEPPLPTQWGPQWGESIMLYPMQEYTLHIRMSRIADGVSFESEVPLKLQNTTGFLRGHSYKVRLVVHGPESIATACSLEPWLDDEVPNPIEM